VTAAAITGGSLSLLSSNNNILIIIVELILFTAISIVMLIYTVKRNEITAEPKIESTKKADSEEKFKIINEDYSFTPREAEVFKLLVTTDNDLQTIADEMYISKRTLERHISSIYKKTQAKSRIGLLAIFNNK
ncbi:MAG: helix-turn-helix transcriptional regulator, partial [Eubacterium sp.]|nr:helix-turn-helix transcriptional regulator [Eubacterium sp.]